MLSRLISNQFKKHKTKLLIILGITIAIIIVSAMVKAKVAKKELTHEAS